MSSNKYILIKHFLDNAMITNILKLASNKKKNDSKVGNNVNKNKKIRQDIFFTSFESNSIDKDIYLKVKSIVDKEFNIQLDYRETYKIGIYNGDDKGFYIPHTDTQGGVEHRKISIVICLSNENEYEGGIFKFIDLNKNFKFDIGDAIIFDSNLLHGVEPITNGTRMVLISFMWDKSGEILRNTKNPLIDNSKYVPS
jgi:hypothetical protein